MSKNFLKSSLENASFNIGLQVSRQVRLPKQERMSRTTFYTQFFLSHADPIPSCYFHFERICGTLCGSDGGGCYVCTFTATGVDHTVIKSRSVQESLRFENRLP